MRYYIILIFLGTNSRPHHELCGAKEGPRMGAVAGQPGPALPRLVPRRHPPAPCRGDRARRGRLPGARLHLPAGQLRADLQDQVARPPLRHPQDHPAAGHRVRTGPVPVRGRALRHGARSHYVLRRIGQTYNDGVAGQDPDTEEQDVSVVVLRVQVSDAVAAEQAQLAGDDALGYHAVQAQPPAALQAFSVAHQALQGCTSQATLKKTKVLFIPII